MNKRVTGVPLSFFLSFFTSEELSNSNTKGTHNKQRLDATKLQALKVLVFSQFPVETTMKKVKAWKAIMSKIDSKCHLSKHIGKHAGERETQEIKLCNFILRLF